MKKLFIFLIVLIMLNILSIHYLKDTLDNKKAYKYEFNNDCFVIPVKDIELYDEEDFEVDDYFLFAGTAQPLYSFTFSDDLVLDVDGKNHHFDYHIKEKEIVEQIVYQEKPVYITRYVENNATHTDYSSNANQKNETNIKTEESYFRLKKSSLSYPFEYDLNKIINDFYGCFDSNISVIIDYSLLNPSIPGEYPVYFIYGDSSSTLVVNIGEAS